jgi:hypothetical protein
MFKVWISLCLFWSISLYAQTAKVVYDLTTGDSSKIEKSLGKNLKAVSSYYQSQNQQLDIIVVISGDAYRYFIDDIADSPYAADKELMALQEKFAPMLKSLSSENKVKFQMCSDGMKARKIQKETLYKFVDAQLTKSVYLINAQNNGYAYLPIH